MSTGDPHPLTPGELLLHLLQNPPHPPPPFPHPPLLHDQAVATLGPALPFHPSQFAPHNFFLQNPNPSPNYPPPNQLPPGFNHNFDPNPIQNLMFGSFPFNIRNDNGSLRGRTVNGFEGTQQPNFPSKDRVVDQRFNGFEGTHQPNFPTRDRFNVFEGTQQPNFPTKDGLGNRRFNGFEGTQQPNLGDRRFNGFEGTHQLNFPTKDGLGDRRFNGFEGTQQPNFLTKDGLGDRRFNGFEGTHQLNFQTKDEAKVGNYRSVIQPPPGFTRKVGDNGWSGSGSGFEQNVDKGKGKFGAMEINGGGLNVNGGGLIVNGGGLNDKEGINGVAVELRDEGREIEDLQERMMASVLDDEGSVEVENKEIKKKEYRADKRGQWLLNQRMRNLKRLTECRSDINRLNPRFLEIFESLIPSEEEKAKQKQLLMLLERHVTKEWPNARLYLYGSCANSFGFRKSDLDVCLTIEDAEVNKAEILLRLADILESDNFQNVQALTRARVPIVKLKDPATGISCDICVNNVLAVVNTKLLRDYAQIDVRLRQLAFIVKHWAKSRGVNETYQGTLSSYAYVLMCVHFLQQRRPAILPCLQGMKSTYAVMFENVECTYFDEVGKLYGYGSRNGETIAQLVWGFFKYWAYCHDYANDVISIRTGSIVSKRVKDWTRRVGNDRHLICIEDPFEVSHDLGRVVDKFSIRVLREEFERAAKIMESDPDPCVKLFEPYVPS